MLAKYHLLICLLLVLSLIMDFVRTKNQKIVHFEIDARKTKNFKKLYKKVVCIK